MVDSPLNIPVYEGSMLSIRSPTPTSILRTIKSAGKRTIEGEIKWKSGSLDRKYECPSCNGYLRFPIQFEDCGHFVCSSCLPDILRVAPRCPKCQQPVSRDKIIQEKSFQKDIQNLEIYCSNKDKGCEWEGILRDNMPHLETCGFVPIECPNGCGIKFEKRFFEKHNKEDCPKRTVACEFCHTTILFEEEILHLNICTEFRIPCPNHCNQQDIPRGQMQNHLDNECAKQELPCPFTDCGCEFRAERMSITKHIKESPGIHLNMAGKTISLQKKLLQLQDERMQEQKKWIELLAKKVNALEKCYGSQLIWKIDGYQEKIMEAKSGKKPTIFSPPFLTSRHGYKLACSACLFGDGKAKGKYLSLFICICRGEYDSLLMWPFSHRVTFTLLDQCEDPDNRRNISYVVKPNTCKENKPFLGRPIGERNASFGAQKFMDLDTMSTLDYIRDDTIYIKVEIDSEDMIVI